MGQKALKKTKILGVGCGYVLTDIRKQFLEIARKCSPEPRNVYSSMTTAIVRTLTILLSFLYLFTLLFSRVISQDTRAMAVTLGAIRVGIVNDNLQSAELLRWYSAPDFVSLIEEDVPYIVIGSSSPSPPTHFEFPALLPFLS
jgi:hypothetical protein